MTVLSEWQLDQVCDRAFPGDKVIRNKYVTKKKAKSYTGDHMDIERLSTSPAPAEPVREPVDPCTLEALGGERLLALYQTGMNFALAADELDIGEAALRKWFSRWKAESPATMRAIARLLSGDPSVN